MENMTLIRNKKRNEITEKGGEVLPISLWSPERY